jgi:hypothetical protein
MSTVVLITVGILTCYHTYCITTNTTTIEGWEKGRSLTIKGMGKIQNVGIFITLYIHIQTHIKKKKRKIIKW